MAYSDEIKKQAVEKRTLVRLEPGKYIVDDLTLVGGLYVDTFTAGPLSKIERNGTELTLVDGVPSSNDEYSYDDDTGALSIKLAAAPDVDDNVIIAYFYVFISTGPETEYKESPADGTGPLRSWKPRIRTAPTVTQSIKDIQNGVLSSSSSSITIMNDDRYFNTYLDKDISFFNKDARIWSVVGGEATKLFIGVCKTVAVSDKLVTIGVQDKFSLFEEPALLGDPYEDAYYSTEETATLDPNKSGTPIPYIFTRSPTKVGGNETLQTGPRTSDGSVVVADTFEPINLTDSMLGGVIVDEFESFGVNIIEYGACRLPSAGLKFDSFGTVSQIQVNDSYNTGEKTYLYNQGLESSATFSYRPYIVVTTDAHNMEIGDLVSCDNVGLGLGGTFTASCVVTQITSTTFEAVIMNVTPGILQGTISTSSLISSEKVCVYLVQGSSIFIIDSEDVLYTTNTLASGHKYIEFVVSEPQSKTLIDGNTGATSHNKHEGMSRATSLNTKLYYRVTTAESSHGDTIKKMFESKGIDFDQDSIDDADTDLDANVILSIPDIGENSFNSYRKYIEQILSSSLGYIGLNDSFEAFYKLFKTPTAGNSTSETSMTSPLSVGINYRDVINKAEFQNKRQARTDVVTTYKPGDPSSYAIKSSNKSRYLHSILADTVIDHVLDNGDRLDAIASVLFSRQNIYKLSTAHKDLDKDIGDNMTVESDNLLGDQSSIDLPVTSISKSEDRVSIQLTEFEDL